VWGIIPTKTRDRLVVSSVDDPVNPGRLQWYSMTETGTLTLLGESDVAVGMGAEPKLLDDDVLLTSGALGGTASFGEEFGPTVLNPSWWDPSAGSAAFLLRRAIDGQ
jgi:hypothetical protein